MHLINDLLDVALLEAGRLRVEFALLLAADLARDAVETQRLLAEASGVTISLEVEPDVRTAWGERRRLLQVFEHREHRARDEPHRRRASRSEA